VAARTESPEIESFDAEFASAGAVASEQAATAIIIFANRMCSNSLFLRQHPSANSGRAANAVKSDSHSPTAWQHV
jgi:hypothetical protein